MPVSIYEVSEDARIEVSQAAHRVDVPVGGRVVATYLDLDRTVDKGEVLVEIDTERSKLQLMERSSKLAGITEQLELLRRQIVAQEHALVDHRQVDLARVDETRAKYREASIATKLAVGEVGRTSLLRESGLATEADFVKMSSEAQIRKAAEDAMSSTLRRNEAEARATEHDIDVEIARMKRDAAILKGQRETEAAAVDVIMHEMEQRRVRSPVAGRLGEITPLQVGSVLHEGDKVGSVIPKGELRVIAEFATEVTIGRIFAGMRARLRLKGFPWTQYGTVAATVSSVASEGREGHVRVELTIDPTAASPVVLRHGLTGVAEVELERITSATLTLRALGHGFLGSR